MVGKESVTEILSSKAVRNQVPMITQIAQTKEVRYVGFLKIKGRFVLSSPIERLAVSFYLLNGTLTFQPFLDENRLSMDTKSVTLKVNIHAWQQISGLCNENV